MPNSSTARIGFWIRLDAGLLCMLATWTIVIKYLNPLCMMWAEIRQTGTGGGPHIMWDFWWIPHLMLAWMLWQGRRYAWEFGILVSIVEIIIIFTKFSLFFSNPDMPRSMAPSVLDKFFTNTWFLNKCFVLAFFLMLLVQLLCPGYRKFLRTSSISSPPERSS